MPKQARSTTGGHAADRSMPRASHPLEVDGREVSVSNLDKPMFPTGFTKGQAIDYYVRISGYLLPHLKDRPITLKRYPNGTTGKHFYEKDACLYAQVGPPFPGAGGVRVMPTFVTSFSMTCLRWFGR